MEEGEGTPRSAAVDGPPGPPAEADSPFLAAASETPPEPVSCRFLVRIGEGGAASTVLDRPDDAHACAALGEPVIQSIRQQELVCLVAAHVNCPRYLRGVLLEVAPEPKPATRPPLSPPVVAAGLLLIGALAASIGFLTVRGGLALPVGSSSPPPVAAASASSRSSPPPTATPSTAPTTSASPGVTSSPSPSASLGPNPSPSLNPPTPAPSSDRYAVLKPCPDAPNCWIYTVRAGDNLQSIANWFGVKYATVLDMNPWIDDPSTIHAGDQLRLPPPTR